MKYWAGILVIALFSGCQQQSTVEKDIIPIPLGFESLVFPNDNEPTREKIALGKKLFFDKNLSGNGTISCASCHIATHAFSDTLSRSLGAHREPGMRNAPSLVNVAYKKLFHRDGGARTLEMQMLSPLEDHLEMDAEFKDIIDYLQNNEDYVEEFKVVFDTLPSMFGLTRAIASYERSLVFGNSAFDRFLNGDSSALSNDQIAGWKLFSSEKMGCTECHTGRLLTDYAYHNVGLERQYQDSGRMRLTLDPNDMGRFETPSLRNIAITYPYMHNGSIATLDSVLIFFENGGGNHPNKSEKLKGFTLSETERNQVLQFFESLTDSAFLAP